MQKFPENNLPAVRQGLVVAYFGNTVAVEASDGQVFQCHLRRNQTLPVVGDKVTWQLEAEQSGIVLSIEPRFSQLARGDKQGKLKPLAANIHRVVIVMAPPPIFSEYLLDRYLVAAELLNIAPILVVNKCDLLDATAEQTLLSRLLPYRNIPYPVLLTSAKTGAGMPALAQALSPYTAVLVGPSGVGKSSLIAALVGEAVKVGEVSAKGAGKHTTTGTRLYHYAEVGCLIDSPGVREFNLWPIAPDVVLQGFKELQAVSQGCKFRNCHHLVEPGCQVQAAVSHGKISAQRLVNYQTLMKEAKAHKKY